MIGLDRRHGVPGLRTPNPVMSREPHNTRKPVNGTFDLATVVQEYEGALLRYVSGLLGPGAAEIEDIVQEAFLRLHRHVLRKGARSLTNLSGWLFRVAHNLAMDAGRKRQRTLKLQAHVLADPAVNPEEVGAQPDPAEASGNKEACRLAMAELQKLPEDDRDIVVLKIVQGFTLREISEITGLKIGTVNYRLNRSLRDLSSRLRKAGAL